MKTFKKTVSLFLAIFMLASSVMSTGNFASESSALANYILAQEKEVEELPADKALLLSTPPHP